MHEARGAGLQNDHDNRKEKKTKQQKRIVNCT
jgi:hypothetical protein